ncbi:MAG: hypothetical protein SGCHY_002679 [Lobulomycetales sp.]
MSAPVRYDLDPNTVAIAQAAAAAAYNEAIVRHTSFTAQNPPPLSPSSPPRYTSLNGGNVSDSNSSGFSPPTSFISSHSAGSSPTDSGPLKKESKKTSLYKTELCRSWEENGTCRYGTKCQFAHSVEEVRTLERHPKYKTELCKTFWDRGSCPYGKRCCFIHTENTERTVGAPVPSSKNRPSSSGGRTPLNSKSESTSPVQPQSMGKSLMGRSQHKTSSMGSRNRSSPPTAIKTMASKTADSTNKLFDQVTNEFSLWSPSLNSPDQTAFPFPNPAASVPPQASKSVLDGSNRIPAEPAFSNTISSAGVSPIGPGPSLKLNTRDAVINGSFGRSALSAGIPSASPFFLDTTNVGISRLFDNHDDTPMSAPATRFPPSIFNAQQQAHGASLRSASVSKVPLLGQPPARGFSVGVDSVFSANSPLSASFSSILDDDTPLPFSAQSSGLGEGAAVLSKQSFAQAGNNGAREPTIIESTRQPGGRAGTLRKFDSGMFDVLQ